MFLCLQEDAYSKLTNSTRTFIWKPSFPEETKQTTEKQLNFRNQEFQRLLLWPFVKLDHIFGDGNWQRWIQWYLQQSHSLVNLKETIRFAKRASFGLGTLMESYRRYRSLNSSLCSKDFWHRSWNFRQKLYNILRVAKSCSGFNLIHLQKNFRKNETSNT